jgi:FkbM family methyltransferase
MNIMGVFAGLIPASKLLPARYLYYKLRGRLDYELSVLPKILASCGNAVDIGANVGIYSYVLSKCCSRVYSFEPIKECADSIKAYAKENIEVINVALSDVNGESELFIPQDDGIRMTGLANLRGDVSAANGERIKIELKRLDDYNLKNLSFMKIDVEGHEYQVLSGAKATILRERPVIFIEIEQRHQAERNMQDVFEQILSHSYEGGFFFKRKFYHIDKFSYEKYQLPYLTNKTSETYVNNFLFWPKGHELML